MATLVRVGARQIAFSGGEPLIRKDLEKMMRDGLKLGMKGYSLVTNGFRADPERVARLRRAGLRSVQVSLDGVDERDHVGIRACSPAAYYRALKAIRVYREAGIAVDAATISVGPNLVRAPEMTLLCRALGVRKLRYCSFVPTGRAAQESIQKTYGAAPERMDAFLEHFRSYREKAKAAPDLVIDHGIGPWRTDGHFACVAGKKVAYITGEGDLYPCPSLMYEPFKVGNVFDTNLAELLARPSLHAVRRMGRQSLDEPCRSCAAPRCTGGCRGAAYAATGDVRAAPVYCNYHRRTVGAESPRVD
jgi:radical SAM protein with 4Fe4S-binding SPASM domain